jgi:hypothetical protein
MSDETPVEGKALDPIVELERTSRGARERDHTQFMITVERAEAIIALHRLTVASVAEQAETMKELDKLRSLRAMDKDTAERCKNRNAELEYDAQRKSQLEGMIVTLAGDLGIGDAPMEEPDDYAWLMGQIRERATTRDPDDVDHISYLNKKLGDLRKAAYAYRHMTVNDAGQRGDELEAALDAALSLPSLPEVHLPTALERTMTVDQFVERWRTFAEAMLKVEVRVPDLADKLNAAVRANFDANGLPLVDDKEAADD